MQNIFKITVLSLFVSSLCHFASASNMKGEIEKEATKIRPPSLSSLPNLFVEQNQTENFIPTGSVISFAGTTAPQGWLMCDGQIISRSEYKKLYEVIGRTYTPVNHNPPLGESLFCVPDMRGRTSVGIDGNASRVTTGNTLGMSGGEEKHQITVDELPEHNHGLRSTTAGMAGPAQMFYGPVHSTLDEKPTESTGKGHAHNNMPPYLVLNYIIKH